MLYDGATPFQSMVDVEKGTVARQIYTDEAIYQLELERIFARAWNFMCHETQIPNPGDFFLSYIGEESVICVRDKKGGFQVFLNSCRHRGNAVCRAEQGNTRSFLCTYHGWTYDLEGKLIGVPGYKDLYHEQLDRSQWGLVSAGKVGSYKGFVFATMDADAPDLDEYLGPIGRMSLDTVAERGQMVAIEGVQKNAIGCNWKLAVDNLFDYYHVDISHASAIHSGYMRRGDAVVPPMMDIKSQKVLVGEYGHAIGGPTIPQELFEAHEAYAKTGAYANDPLSEARAPFWRDTPKARAALGELGREVGGHPNIFPNLWITEFQQLCLRLPKGPMKTELWWFSMVPVDTSETVQKMFVHRANHTFGASGFLEQDDGENWDQSTRAMRGVVARRYPVNFQMNLGRGVSKQGPDGVTYIDARTNEHAQLWTYRAWAEWMDADNWDALRANHSKPPAAGETL